MSQLGILNLEMCWVCSSNWFFFKIIQVGVFCDKIWRYVGILVTVWLHCSVELLHPEDYFLKSVLWLSKSTSDRVGAFSISLLWHYPILTSTQWWTSDDHVGFPGSVTTKQVTQKELLLHMSQNCHGSSCFCRLAQSSLENAGHPDPPGQKPSTGL